MRRKLLSVMSVAVLQAGIAVVVAYPDRGTAQVAQTFDPAVSMVLIKQSDGSTRELAGEKLELTSQKVELKDGDSIEKLLAANGIQADAEAISVIYHLNPDLKEMSVRPGSELILPQVQGGRNLQKALEEGYLVALILDKELKERLLNDVKELKALAERFSGLQSRNFENPQDRDEIIESIEYVVDALGIIRIVIREKGRPLSTEMLRQISGETELLKAMLKDHITANKSISKADGEKMNLIAEDMQVRMRTFDEKRGPGELPPRWRDVPVVVEALNAKDDSAAHNLRVYYVPEALYGKKGYEQSFDALTSPAEGILPEANYLIWIGKPGDPTPLSDLKKLHVRKKGEQEMSMQLVIH